MRFSIFVLMGSLFLFAGCAGTPGKRPAKAEERVKTEEKKPVEEPVEEPREEQEKKPKEEEKESLNEKVGEAIRLWEEFYKKRLLERKFDYELLVRAIEALESVREDVRAALALSPSDEELRDLSSRIEPKLSKLKEEKIAHDLEEKAKKETEQLMRQAVEGKQKESDGKGEEKEK